MFIAAQRENSTNEFARQFIVPPRIQQMALADRMLANNPSMMAFRGLPGATTEVTAQQVEDQINQLNRLSQQLRALPQSPSAFEQLAKEQQNPVSGYVQQASRLTPETGFGRPLGAVPGYVKTIAGNPLTGPNGLTKEVLADLMFGNLKSLASTGGLANFNNPVEENELPPQTLGTSELSAFNNPLIEEKLRQSPLGKPGIGFPLPPNENVDFNDLPNDDLDTLKDFSNIHARHNTKSGRKKKPVKSDVVTKLLLSLLVDKLKDIYEMDKFNTTQNKSLKTKVDSSTIGKIGNALKERSQPKNRKNPTDKAGESNIKVIQNFDSNLSFPLTISDQKGSKVSLIDSPQNGGKDDSSAINVDTKNIENIIKGIENGNVETKENSSTQRTGNGVDSGNSPQEISEKTTKTLDDVSLFNKGSSTEFHQVKIEPDRDGVLGKSGTIPTISNYHPTVDTTSIDPNPGTFDVQTDKATVSTLPTFSISSILNQEIPGSVKGSNRVLDNNALKDVKAESIGLGGSPSTEEPVSSKAAGESDTVDYLQASRVLGAVFNKVRDPLARKSVEVAIKAMLKLMKSDSAYSKKQTVPSVEEPWVNHEKMGRLMRTIHQLSKAVDKEAQVASNKKRRQWRSKHKILKKWISHKHSHHRHKSRLVRHHTHKY